MTILLRLLVSIFLFLFFWTFEWLWLFCWNISNEYATRNITLILLVCHLFECFVWLLYWRIKKKGVFSCMDDAKQMWFWLMVFFCGSIWSDSREVKQLAPISKKCKDLGSQESRAWIPISQRTPQTPKKYHLEHCTRRNVHFLNQKHSSTRTHGII